MKRLLSVYTLLLVVLTSCSKENDFSGDVINDTAFAASLRLMPDTLVIEENSIRFDVNAYRDFMPLAEPNGSPLLVIGMLTETDSLELSVDLLPYRFYVISGNSEVWISKCSNVVRNGFMISASVRDGPKWGPDIPVDVVCELKYLGKTYFVIVRNQMIFKTA